MGQVSTQDLAAQLKAAVVPLVERFIAELLKALVQAMRSGPAA